MQDAEIIPAIYRRFIQEVEEHLFAFSTSCQYGRPCTATYQEALFDRIPDQLMGLFLAAGYRRYGDRLYKMNCSGCKACVPLRVRPEAFVPNRSQRRVLKKNQDLTIESGPIRADDETLALLGKFLRIRFRKTEDAPWDSYRYFFQNSITNTSQIDYRLGSQLVGVAIVDAGKKWQSAVYFFFDPDFSPRSPGTYNILHLIDLCNQAGQDFLYLGYWIEGLDAMRYKANFNPHEILQDGEWRTCP